MIILDSIFSILIKPSVGVLELTSSLKHYSFVLLDGEMVLCCIMTYTNKVEISRYVITVFGIFTKLDHVGTNVIQNHACGNAISGTDVFVIFYE